jgi:AcrR family transcriptional regulator
MRDPERTRERILAAALKEFAAYGYTGARVDRIARRARINKRMLYHYFGDKRGLFRVILRRKLTEKREAVAATPGDPRESLPYWFDLACRDRDWIRLMQWEALHDGGGSVIDEEERRASFERGLADFRERQARGLLSSTLEPDQALLSMMALTTFPIAFPQLTRLITGLAPTDPKFQEARTEFLRGFATAFRPPGAAR